MVNNHDCIYQKYQAIIHVFPFKFIYYWCFVKGIKIHFIIRQRISFYNISIGCCISFGLGNASKCSFPFAKFFCVSAVSKSD